MTDDEIHALVVEAQSRARNGVPDFFNSALLGKLAAALTALMVDLKELAK